MSTSTTQAPVTDPRIATEKLTSEKEVSYEVGRPNVTPAPVEEGLVGSKANFQVNVNWTVGSNDWIDTPLNIRNTTAIWRYKLHKSKSPFFDYVLEISITDDHYNYYFGDGTGDAYSIDTYVAGDHSVSYNSKNPTITSISGS